MTVIQLNTQHFTKLPDGRMRIRHPGMRRHPGMLLIWAEWCPHCITFKPTFEEVARQLGPNFNAVAIEDTQLKTDPSLGRSLNFSGFPTVMFFDQMGVIQKTYDGKRDRPSMFRAICQLYERCARRP